MKVSSPIVLTTKPDPLPPWPPGVTTTMYTVAALIRASCWAERRWPRAEPAIATIDTAMAHGSQRGEIMTGPVQVSALDSAKVPESLACRERLLRESGGP